MSYTELLPLINGDPCYISAFVGVNHAVCSRVAFVLPSARIGGAERQTLNLLERFVAIGISTTLIVGTVFRERMLYVPRDITLIVANVTWNENESDAKNSQLQADSLRSILPRIQPDVVIITLPWPSFGLGLQQALTEANIPYVNVFHLAPHVFHAPPKSAPAEAKSPISNTLSCWVAVSKPVARRIEILYSLIEGSVTVIQNGVALPVHSQGWRSWQRRKIRECLHIPHQQRLVLIVGRLDRAKGIDLVPAIIELLANRNITIACAGEGPLESMLKKLSQAHPTAFQLLGEITNAQEWMIAADLLLIPSRLEGCPLVFLEAASTRCPVVATDSALEFLGSEAFKLAHVVPTNNVAAIANRVHAILDMPTLSDSMVTSAAHYVSKFTEARMVGSYIRLLRKLVTMRRARVC